MTTKITVDAHAGLPVEVTKIDNGVEVETVIVQPNTTETFHVFDTRDLRIHEIQPNEIGDPFDENGNVVKIDANS